MKQLQKVVVKKGTKGRLQITLSTSSSETLSAWMDGSQAEYLAVQILSNRFDIPALIIDAPKRKRKRSPVFVSFRTLSPLGRRPEVSEQLLKKVERDYPDLRSQLKDAQDRWDQRHQRRQAKMPPRERGFFD